MADRPSIPADLRRQVLVEAGHRCAIPTCRQHPVDIDHIEHWAKVREHIFENLIALCPTCHRRKTTGEIDRKAIRQYKVNLAVLNSRYTDLEMQLLRWFVQYRTGMGYPHLPNGMTWAVGNLLLDGLIRLSEDRFPDFPIKHMRMQARERSARYVLLTDEGRNFISRMVDARPLGPGI